MKPPRSYFLETNFQDPYIKMIHTILSCQIKEKMVAACQDQLQVFCTFKVNKEQSGNLAYLNTIWTTLDEHFNPDLLYTLTWQNR